MMADPPRSSTDGATAMVELTLLGKPCVRRPFEANLPLSPQDGALAALVALDGPWAREALARRVWPAIESHKSYNNLRKHVSRLHADLGGRLFELGDSVTLARGVAVDALSLATTELPSLMDAGDLLAGQTFADNDTLRRWVEERRRRSRVDLADALTAHAEALEQQDKLALSIKVSERIVALVPLREHAWRRVMRQHYRRGDRTAAIDAFERFEAQLREATGARPGEETLALLATIERSTTSMAGAVKRLPDSVLHPPLSVGREREGVAMRRAWSAGRAFLIVGEAGIGKSRLLADCAREHGGSLVVRGRPGDDREPYSLLAGIVQAMQEMPSLAKLESVRVAPVRLLPTFGGAPIAGSLWRGVEGFFQAAMSAGLSTLLVDDLHFGDLASVEALRWLVASPRLEALRFGFATRPVSDGPIASLLRKWLDDSGRPERIAPQLLGADDVVELVDSLALGAEASDGLAGRLFAHAGGHPYFMLETLKDLLLRDTQDGAAPLPLPATVFNLIERRLGELPADARALAHVAAIAGNDLTPERAAHLLDRHPLALIEPWAMLANANLLRGAKFAHDLVRECALRLVPDDVRRSLHGALAALLTIDPNVPRSRVAEHWEAARHWAQAGACWFAAGRVARLSGRLVEQETLLERAAVCHRHAGDAAAEFDALHAAFDSKLLRHGGVAVLAALPRAEQLAGTAGQRLQCSVVRAGALIELERGAEAAEIATTALLEAGDDPIYRSESQSLLGMALAQLGRHDEAIEMARAAVEAARSARSLPQALRSVRSLAYALYAGARLADAISTQRDAVALAEELGDRAEAAVAIGNLAALLDAVGDGPGCHWAAQQARARFLEMGMSIDSALACVNLILLGTAAAGLGLFDQALDALEQALALAGPDATASVRAKARVALAGVWLTLGRFDEARALMADLPDATRVGMRMQAELILARAERMAGGTGELPLARMGALMTRHPELPLVQAAWVDWSYQGEPAAVIERLREIRTLYEAQQSGGHVRTLIVRETARLNELLTANAIREAHAHAVALMPAVEESLSSKTYPPEAWAVLAQAFGNAGDAPAALLCRQRARAWITERALPTIRPDCRASFLACNPVNAALLADA